MTNFEQAKAQADKLHAEMTAASRALNNFVDQFPKGPMNLTPDHVRAMPEYRVVKNAYERAFSAVRAFNGPYVKKYKKEIQADRAKRLNQKSLTATLC